MAEAFTSNITQRLCQFQRSTITGITQARVLQRLQKYGALLLDVKLYGE